MKLTNKVAVVTGGARGIGAGITRCLAEEGARVAIIDIDGAEAEKTANDIDGAIGLAADCSETEATAAAVEQAAAELGGLDIMVNNAGAGTGREMSGDLVSTGFENLPQESWDRDIRNNLRTTFAGSRAAIPHLKTRGGGAIVNIASIAGLRASPQLAAYGAAKSGVIHLTRSLALELAPSDIRVNAICPGFLWTRAWQTLAEHLRRTVPTLKDKEPHDIFVQAVKTGVPLGREQTVEDIGRLTIFLSSADARNITGQEIKVDGGITLKG